MKIKLAKQHKPVNIEVLQTVDNKGVIIYYFVVTRTFLGMPIIKTVFRKIMHYSDILFLEYLPTASQAQSIVLNQYKESMFTYHVLSGLKMNNSTTMLRTKVDY